VNHDSETVLLERIKEKGIAAMQRAALIIRRGCGAAIGCVVFAAVLWMLAPQEVRSACNVSGTYFSYITISPIDHVCKGCTENVGVFVSGTGGTTCSVSLTGAGVGGVNITPASQTCTANVTASFTIEGATESATLDDLTLTATIVDGVEVPVGDGSCQDEETLSVLDAEIDPATPTVYAIGPESCRSATFHFNVEPEGTSFAWTLMDASLNDVSSGWSATPGSPAASGSQTATFVASVTGYTTPGTYVLKVTPEGEDCCAATVGVKVLDTAIDPATRMVCSTGSASYRSATYSFKVEPAGEDFEWTLLYGAPSLEAIGSVACATPSTGDWQPATFAGKVGATPGTYVLAVKTDACTGATTLLTVAGLDITEIKGLYDEDGDYEAGYTSDDGKGRVYSNRLSDDTKTKENDKQYVEIEVQVEPTSLLNANSRIYWESEDPDDPSDNTTIDPLGAGGDDNTGKLEADPSDAANYPFTAATSTYGVTAQTRTATFGAVCGTAKTELDANGISKVRFHVTDNGGDNFKVKATLLVDGTTDSGCSDQTGIFTTWKNIDVEVRQMGAAYTLPTATLEALMEEVYVQIAVDPGTDTTNYQYLDGVTGPTPSAFINAFFSQKDQPQWHFLCGCRSETDLNDYDPSTPVTATVATTTTTAAPTTTTTGTGTTTTTTAGATTTTTTAAPTTTTTTTAALAVPGPGKPLSGTTYQANNGGLVPNAYKDKGLWLMPNESQTAPSWTQRLDFPIVDNSANVFTVARIPSKFSGVEVDVYFVNGDPPGAVDGDIFNVTRDRFTGRTGNDGVNLLPEGLIFIDTIKNFVNADPANLDFDIVRDATICHEFVHGFNIHHLCQKMSINETDPCLMQWSTTPVKQGGDLIWLDLKNGAVKLCPEHMLMIRDADGY